ncbi:pyridoxamine 5'-phosphate oxidase [Sphingobacterium hungaricum]|uniref:Pyridoxine/pyridoxamine 5'-phosphate oxidase n=1 Tax=Sphingobacterium hungaricum TaxID=2082723 RepID=A0A928YS15_9SPHI|nr:pyridoxamine 5'-phosphate oxidase [Sphingobacterium hungaricum]MBE8715257.1 pyridoxamine 5'-phosphate oxidase [Sphingobacterium hungaricum]
MSIQHKEIAAIREEYSKGYLLENDVLENPIFQFKKWFSEAISAEVKEPNAMVLSTVNQFQSPSSRVVLLKDIKDNGFSFFTNYESRKAEDMLENPKVSLLFFWQELQRQVRIEGVVSKLPSSDSDEYFSSRPRGSRIGAIASPQSQVIVNREELEAKVDLVTNEFSDLEIIPRPEFWGGYLVEPTLVEFWQGRSSRLHDRIVYELRDQANWLIKRLAP